MPVAPLTLEDYLQKAAYGDDGAYLYFLLKVLMKNIGYTDADFLNAVPNAEDYTVRVGPSADQDPIFDAANGTKTSVTTSTTIITPPANCKYVRIGTDVDIFVRTDGSAAVDDGTSIRIVANQPEVVPVTPGVPVKGLSSSGTATVRCMPMKSR